MFYGQMCQYLSNLAFSVCVLYLIEETKGVKIEIKYKMKQYLEKNEKNENYKNVQKEWK